MIHLKYFSILQAISKHIMAYEVFYLHFFLLWWNWETIREYFQFLFLGGSKALRLQSFMYSTYQTFPTVFFFSINLFFLQSVCESIQIKFMRIIFNILMINSMTFACNTNKNIHIVNLYLTIRVDFNPHGVYDTKISWTMPNIQAKIL